MIENTKINDIKEIDSIVDLMIKIHSEKGNVSLEYISNELIDNISKFDDETLEKIVELLRVNYDLSVHDEIVLAQRAYGIGEFDKSLFLLGIIEGTILDDDMRELIYELKIYNFTSTRRYKDSIDTSTELISHLGTDNDSDALELYTEKIIQSKSYERGLKYLNHYLEFNNSEISKEKKSTIENYIMQIKPKKELVNLSITDKLKSMKPMFINILKKKDKKVIKIALSFVIVLSFIFQYGMYATGAWKPISAKPYVKLDNLILEKGETYKYKKSIGIKKFPFYSKYPKEKIVVDDVSILDKRDGNIIALENGQTDIILYMDEIEYGRSTINVSDIKLESYTIRYEGEPEFVGDIVTPNFEYKFRDHRTKDYDVMMKSDNEDVIEIDDGDIVAVGSGKATVSVNIDGIIKYLTFDIREDVEYKAIEEYEDFADDEENETYTTESEDTTLDQENYTNPQSNTHPYNPEQNSGYRDDSQNYNMDDNSDNDYVDESEYLDTPSSNITYRVIIDTFAIRENAVNQVIEVNELGLDAMILPIVSSENKTLYSVLSGSYEMRENAEEQLEILRLKGYNPVISTVEF